MQQRTSYRRHDPLSDAIEGAIAGVILAVAALVKLLAKAIYAYWHELAMVVILAASFWGTDRLAGRPVAIVLIGLVVVVPWLPLPKKWMIGRVLATARENLRTMWHVWSVRRRWRTAAAHADLHGWRVRKVRSTPVGDVLDVRARRLGQVTGLVERREDLARRLGLIDIHVTREPSAGQDRLDVTLVRRDPFADYVINSKGKQTIRPLLWPNKDAKELSGWDPILMGIDKNGDPVTFSLFEHNAILGGIPGSGKSNGMSLIAAHGALSPDVNLWMVDGKRLEFEAWRPCAHRLVIGPERKDVIDLLREYKEELDRRTRTIGSGNGGERRRKLTPEHDLPFELLMIDELATFLLAEPTDKAGKQQAGTILELLRYCVANARALGLPVTAATQKPDSQTVDTRLRDLIDTRMAYKCLTPQASDTILGQGWASNPNFRADASTIPGAQRGVGYLYAEGELPTLTRCYWLGDDDLDAIAARATGREIDSEWEKARVPTT